MTVVKAEKRFNNVVFFCMIEQKWYNARDHKAYLISNLGGVIPIKNDKGGFDYKFNIEPLIICEHCFNDKNDKGLGFEEPSNLVVPVAGQAKTILSKIKKGAN